ncbi:MAG: XisH family protein [Candidatus Thiothrix sulfatifontis]|nr:MAG: XisH family protein [Candidatus Thiothrix sulfatifontis]
MPARDIYHDSVKHALEKGGWNVTDDPFLLRAGAISMYVDLGAERLLAATKNEEKIAVEIKCFLRASDISEFHAALGQFMNYRLALSKQEPDRVLYLAVPADTYDSFFTQPFIQDVLHQYQVKLIVFKPDQEVISQWIS